MLSHPTTNGEFPAACLQEATRTDDSRRPPRNTTQLAQAVPEFSHSGTATRGGSSLTENAQQRFFVAKQRSAVMLSLFRGEH